MKIAYCLTYWLGKDNPPAGTLHSRPKEARADLTPAPGDYNPEKSEKVVHDNSPKYTFGHKTQVEKPSQTPGIVFVMICMDYFSLTKAFLVYISPCNEFLFLHSGSLAVIFPVNDILANISSAYDISVFQIYVD